MPIDFKPLNTNIDFQPMQEDTTVATIDFQPEEIKPRKSIKEFLLTPISKQVTGKSLTERAGLVKKQQKSLDVFASKRAEQGKPPGVGELFMRGLPGYTGETLLNLADISPLDVGIMAGTAGLAKVPVKGVPLGEIASKIPLNKRFFKNIEELARYQQTLKTITPLSSRGVTKTISPTITEKAIPSQPTGEGKVTPDFAENINLKKYPQDVRQTISDLVTQKPELGKTPTISDDVLIKMASELKDTPTIKHLATLPEGTVEAEALKLRQGNVESIRNALSGELVNLKNKLDTEISQGIQLHRKTASMFGRGLRQQRLPAETQQNMAFTIDDTIKKISKDPIFSKDKELIDTVKKLRSIVVEKEFNPTLWNKVYFTWLNSILSNPFTHLVNTASNTFFAIAKIPEKFASAVWDLPLALRTGKRTQFFGEIPAMIKGAISKETLPEGVAIGSKIDYLTQPIRGKIGKFIGTPTQWLQIEDNLDKTIVGRMELYAQRYAGKTGEALTKVVKEEQLYRSFQNDTGAIAESLMFLRSKIPGLRYVIPFIRTPANLIARGLERTPLALAKIAKGAVAKTYTQETLAKDLGNLTLGTIGAGWVGLQFAKGNVTGRVSSNPAEKDAFYRQGKKPNAIKIGEKWIPLDRLEPLGTSFATMVNLIQDYKNSGEETPPEKILDAIGKLGSNLINKTYLSGFTNLINVLSNPEMYGAKYLQRFVSGYEPQLLKFFADLKDPYYREANTVLEQLKAKTPFASETLPPKLNALGEPVKRDLFNIGTATKEPIEKLLEETPVTFPGKVMGKEKLKPEEYRYILEQSGQGIKQVLNTLSVDDFLKLPLEVREEIISNLVSQVRKPYRGMIRSQRELEKLNIDFQPIE